LAATAEKFTAAENPSKNAVAEELFIITQEHTRVQTVLRVVRM